MLSVKRKNQIDSAVLEPILLAPARPLATDLFAFQGFKADPQIVLWRPIFRKRQPELSITHKFGPHDEAQLDIG